VVHRGVNVCYLSGQRRLRIHRQRRLCGGAGI